jgi:hypothetical protein
MRLDTLDTLDALHLDHTLADLATGLRRLGDPDPLEVRRAKAVGVLADPQQALHLLTTGALTPSTGGRWVELYLHLDASDLTDPADPADPPDPPDPTRGTGGGEIEGLGAATRDLLADWLGRPDLAGVTLRPVLDLHTPEAVDRHDPRPGCGTPRRWPTPPACSPAAPATPDAATWTTSSPISRPRTAAHRARPG